MTGDRLTPRDAIRLALPLHGGVCDGTDERPSAKDPRGSFANPCIRCRVLLAYDDALARFPATSPARHRGSCRIHYAENVCTCGAEEQT